MTDSIKEYNSRVCKAWRIQGRNYTTLVALRQATPTVITMLEDHYSTVRHTEGALTLEQLGYCDWSVGVSRIPPGLPNVPPMWTEIMSVSSQAIEEFVRRLAR